MYHTCRTYFSVEFEFDTKRNAELLRQRSEHAPEEIGIFNKDEVEKFIKENFNVTPVWYRHHFVIGYNGNFNVDVNEMVRVSLKDLFGKERKIKELQKKFPVSTVLEIIPQIIVNNKQPKPYLSLERDIISFLHKSNTILDLDYYVF